MRIRNTLASWKYPLILLVGVGVANVGAWIYLIALNLIVLDMTGSALAVAGLYVITPLAAIVTNSWSGSIIDRLNKRNFMIYLDFSRAIIIALLPAFSDLWAIYLLVFIISMGNAVFAPTSMTYITMLIPSEQRKRFNSLRSLIDSGGFLIGPAIAGLLFIIGSPSFAIYMNAVALLLSGMVTLLMPNLEKNRVKESEMEKLSFDVLKKDWKIVWNFSHKRAYIMIIYFLFSCVMVMTAAIDSLEAAFSKEVLSLSNTTYGFLVSIAGAGIAVGAIVNTVIVKKLPTSLLIGGGSILLSIGYITYAFSQDFTGAAIGFFLLSFALAFADTGFQTFCQNHIPVDMMGRIVSIYGIIEAMLVILSTIIVGLIAQLLSIQFVVICGALLMLVLAVILFAYNVMPSKSEFY